MLLCAHEFAALAERVAQAEKLLVLTGAGMSAESGVPTFREAQTGLWARFSPEDLATPEAFAANPERVMDWYRWRRGLVAAAEPNAGHRAVARRQRTHARTAVVTQNVDGLHQRARMSSSCMAACRTCVASAARRSCRGRRTIPAACSCTPVNRGS
jgi:NAD-dependent SIR2 family protein deacetylase